MIFIAHRGNITGKQADFENNPEYVNNALKKGYDVEVDVWVHNRNLYLGHDEPIHLVAEEFLLNERIWCHCKNLDALYKLHQINAHCFWHKKEDVVFTSRGIIWTFPRKRLLPGSVCVLPELGFEGKIDQCFGICSDDIAKWKSLIEEGEKNEIIRSSPRGYYDGAPKEFS